LNCAKTLFIPHLNSFFVIFKQNLFTKTGFSAPVVSPITNINYTLSLSTDPVDGPYTTSASAGIFAPIIIRLNQWTAGPKSNVSVSFGDGSPLQNFSISASNPVNIVNNYTTSGIYTITATPLAIGLNVTLAVNNMTVNVLPNYQCN
jgi:hypothetical protein